MVQGLQAVLVGWAVAALAVGSLHDTEVGRRHGGHAVPQVRGEGQGERLTADEFYDGIEATDGLELLGIEGEAFRVAHHPTQARWEVQADGLAAVAWELLRSVLVGERDPIILTHMTRVCGYFGKIENFNRSKLGELEARRRGQREHGAYSIDGGGPERE